MKPNRFIVSRSTRRSFGVMGSALLFILAVGLACNTPTEADSSQTQIALNVRATQIAGETLTAQAASQAGEGAEEPDHQATSDAQATQLALDVQATVDAQQEASSDQSADNPAPSDTPTPSETPESEPASDQPATNPEDFETWMQSASILLYEDMTGNVRGRRYIKPALEAMGLKQFVDVRDALGNYKTQLLSGGPGGQGWDLIISGKEDRASVQGEFYVYLNDALNQGSSVIIEDWDVDGIASGKISAILSRCGVRLHRDWINQPLSKQLLFPINGPNPIHHFPNEGIALTNPSGFWQGFDLGDLLKLRPGSAAIPLWGARVNVTDSYLTAVSCLDGQLIIQTYSSHSYGEDRIMLMWQNYIHNALKTRYEYLQGQ
jgi:hypothetical protein